MRSHDTGTSAPEASARESEAWRASRPADREPNWSERLRSSPTTQSVSWRLGERVASAEDVTRAFEFERPDHRTTLTAYAANAETYLVRWRSPVGRCAYFEVPRPEFERDVERRVRNGRWRVARPQ